MKVLQLIITSKYKEGKDYGQPIRKKKWKRLLNTSLPKNNNLKLTLVVQ